MPAANVLTGDLMGDIYGITGSGGPEYPTDGTSDAIQAPVIDSGDTTSIKVACILVLGVAFIVVLRRSGFRDMVAT